MTATATLPEKTQPKDLTFVALDETFQLALQDGEPHAIYKHGDIFGQNAPASLQNYANLARHAPDGCGVLKAKVLVTGTCNQRCYYCSVAADWDKRGLSTDDLLTVLRRLKEAGILHVQFHGGDVAVRKDLARLLAELETLDLSVDFFTNGTGPVWRDEEVYDTIERMKVPPVVTLSFLGGEPEVHDRLAGLKGAYERAVHTAWRLLEVGAPVRISASLTNESFDQLGKLKELAQSLDCQLSVITEVYGSVGGVIDTASLTVSKEEILRARDDVLGDAVVELTKKNCTAGLSSVTIDHDGHLVGCDRNVTRRFGSLLEQPLAELVDGDEYKAFVKSFYRRPAACETCPSELSRFCNWCPATPFNFGLEQDQWTDFHCQMAMKRRLFWTRRDNAVPGSRPAAQCALEDDA